MDTDPWQTHRPSIRGPSVTGGWPRGPMGHLCEAVKGTWAKVARGSVLQYWYKPKSYRWEAPAKPQVVSHAMPHGVCHGASCGIPRGMYTPMGDSMGCMQRPRAVLWTTPRYSHGYANLVVYSTRYPTGYSMVYPIKAHRRSNPMGDAMSYTMVSPGTSHGDSKGA